MEEGGTRNPENEAEASQQKPASKCGASRPHLSRLGRRQQLWGRNGRRCSYRSEAKEASFVFKRLATGRARVSRKSLNRIERLFGNRTRASRHAGEPECEVAAHRRERCPPCNRSGRCYCPVPVSGAVCGLPPPLSATLRVALRAPVAVGLKATLTAQLALPAIVAPQELFAMR